MIKGQYLSYGDDLTKVHEIRKAVFTEEYGIPEDVELDDDDIMAMHVILDYENEKVGTGRMKDDGETFILDKMAVLKEHRNNGYGEFIVRMLLDKVFLANGKEIFTDATKDTVEFFKKIGFVEIGDEYERDKLIYVPMKVQKGSVKTKCGGH